MKAGVVVFPGSNCDRDVAVALEASTGEKPVMLWHRDHELPELDLIVVPGGFSYGDYLRCGSISANSPIMQEVKKFADDGGYVLGICNGFQVLTETGLLPGALMRNRDIKFICKDIYLKPENTDTNFTRLFADKEAVMFPIAHHDGNFFADEETLKSIEQNGQVAFRYSDDLGEVNDNTNPNGSLNNIAGIFNKNKNVLGLMPHPERSSDAETAGIDGKLVFDSLLAAFA
jgi:phosphoribosylformylglycinamidine synthase